MTHSYFADQNILLWRVFKRANGILFIYLFIFQIGTAVTNALIKARKAVNKDFAGETEDIPIVSTSVAYGVYMAISSNLRYG